MNLFIYRDFSLLWISVIGPTNLVQSNVYLLVYIILQGVVTKNNLLYGQKILDIYQKYVAESISLHMSELS